MKLLILIFLFSFSGDLVFAQQNITGVVTDEKHQPAAFVNISLLRVKDSVALKTTASDDKGSYKIINVRNGNYRIAVSAIGYQKLVTAVFSIQNKDLMLPELQIFPSSKQLSGITINGKRPFLEAHPDKLIVNVAGSNFSSGVNAAEILRRVPGIRVLNDRISMTGKNKVVIMVDGRLSQHQDLNALLRAIPGNNIDRIEVISNPSAKYDAEGDAVINLILKKKQDAGTNGTFGLASGGSFYRLNEVYQGNKIYQRYNPSASVNYQNGRFNFNASYDYQYRQQFEVNLINRIKDDSYYDQRNYNPLNYDTHTYRAGFDFKTDSSNTFGLQISVFNRSGNGDYKNISRQNSLSSGQYLDAFTSENNQTNHNSNTSVNLNWRHNFAKAGQILSADLDAAEYIIKNKSDIEIYPADGNKIRTLQRVANPVNFETIKVDYVHPFAKDKRLETGVKSSIARVDNNLFFEQNGISDALRSNHFLYQENINAAYVNFFWTYKKLDFQTGLRAEQTRSKGNSAGIRVLRRNNIQAFPSILFTRRLDSVLAITVQYGRRIGRPSYQQQNPFEVYLDPLTYTKGNPLLRPQISSSAKLSLTYTGLPVIAFSYDETRNVIVDYAPQQKMIADANGKSQLVSFSVADNLARSKNLSAQLNFPVKAGKIVDGYGGIITTLQRYNAFYQGSNFDVSKWNFTFFVQADIKFNATWSGQINAYYATPSLYEFIYAGKNSSVDAGIAKKIGSKAKIMLNFADLFFGDKTLGKINYQDINLKLKQYNDTRSAILAFTYNFGKQYKPAESHITGSEEEIKRVKTN